MKEGQAMPGTRFSQSTDMAIHGLWSLACLEAERFLLLSDIARTQNVSESYLSKVFQKLTHAGLLQAVRGKNGGYALARPPATITVGDVVRAIEADPPMYQCLAEERCCEAVENCLLLHVFGEAERQMYAVLDGVTLADLLVESTRGAKRMRWLPPHGMLHTLTPLPQRRVHDQ
jgi:Rrf2 family nitric oxide-sensitive transcriptional repressor